MEPDRQVRTTCAYCGVGCQLNLSIKDDRIIRIEAPFDAAPTLCSLMGFPPSAEMSGRTLAGNETSRIATYGARITSVSPAKVNEEYYENLKSLGYIR